MTVPKPSLKQKAYGGLKSYFILACYLWVVFGLFVLYKSFVLSEHRMPFVLEGLALVNALALAKVMLVAQGFVPGWLNEVPLIWTTLLKSAAFAIILGCFKVVEETLLGLYRGLSYEQSIVVAVGNGTLMGALVVMAMLAVVLIPFVAFTELNSILGKDNLKTLFLAPRRVGVSIRTS